jgi:hypothetical protein
MLASARMLAVLLSQAAHGLQLADVPPLHIHAHLTSRAGLEAGAEASTSAAQAEHSRLEELVTSLQRELEIAQLEHQRIKKVAEPPPTAPPELPSPLPPMVEVLASDAFHRALRVYVDSQAGPASNFVTGVAVAAGEMVGAASADAAARHASEVVAESLVKVACNFSGSLAEHAAAEGAAAAANMSWTTASELQEAASLARGAAADDAVENCLADALPVLEAAKGNATAAGAARGTNSSVLAAKVAAMNTSRVLAQRVADSEYVRLLSNYSCRLRSFAKQMAMRVLQLDNATSAKYPSGTAEVAAQTAAVERVAQAAKRLVLGSEKVAAAAALKAAAPDIPERVNAAVSVHHKKIQIAEDNVTITALVDDADPSGELMDASGTPLPCNSLLCKSNRSHVLL